MKSIDWQLAILEFWLDQTKRYGQYNLGQLDKELIEGVIERLKSVQLMEIENKSLKDRNEMLNRRQVACSVLSIKNTRESLAGEIDGMEKEILYSAEVGDVIRCVEREMDWREAYNELSEKYNKLKLDNDSVDHSEKYIESLLKYIELLRKKMDVSEEVCRRQQKRLNACADISGVYNKEDFNDLMENFPSYIRSSQAFTSVAAQVATRIRNAEVLNDLKKRHATLIEKLDNLING